jgi:hypothetical protein
MWPHNCNDSGASCLGDTGRKTLKTRINRYRIRHSLLRSNCTLYIKKSTPKGLQRRPITPSSPLTTNIRYYISHTIRDKTAKSELWSECGLETRWTMAQFSESVKDLFVSSKHESEQRWGLYSKGTNGSFPGVRWWKREAESTALPSDCHEWQEINIQLPTNCMPITSTKTSLLCLYM